MFQVHVDASPVMMGVVLAWPREGNIDHPISFSSWKFSPIENTYTSIERKGLAYDVQTLPTREFL